MPNQDEILKRAADYVDESIEKFRKLKMKASNVGKKKGKSQGEILLAVPINMQL